MKNTISALLIIFLIGCANVSNKDEDPLKNTKRLVKDGHISLYKNGAINIPSTEIMLIPPGPDAVSFALELSGLRARKSFLKSLHDAKNSVYLVADGSRKSYKTAKGIIKKTDDVAEYISAFSRESSKLLIYRAYPDTQHIIGETFQFSKKTNTALLQLSKSMREESQKYGRQATKRQKYYAEFTESALLFAGDSVVDSIADVGDDFKSIGSTFIKGYIALPKKWKQRNNNNIGKYTSPFKVGLDYSLNAREDMSSHFTDIFVNAGSNYKNNIASSLSNSKKSIKSASDTGVGLAALDSVRWVLQALLWDATISPITKLSYASVGYITSNAIVFPVMVVAAESGAATKVAVEVAFNTGRKTIDFVAPTFEAALASTFAASSFAVNSVGGVALGATGVVLSTTIGTADAFSALAISTAGSATGYGIEYIGVPLATAGVTLSGTTSGVVAGSAKAIAGSTLYIGGEITSATVKTVGRAGAGAIMVAGTSAAITKGTGIGVYSLSKAIAVPASFQLGGGIVLGYSSTSHIAAHTILAAADASYLVLSLEGPRWVIYAVKGNLGNGDKLVPGTILELNEMRKSGEAFSVLPVDDDELKIVASEVQGDLPFVLEEKEGKSEGE